MVIKSWYQEILMHEKNIPAEQACLANPFNHRTLHLHLIPYAIIDLEV